MADCVCAPAVFARHAGRFSESLTTSATSRTLLRTIPAPPCCREMSFVFRRSSVDMAMAARDVADQGPGGERPKSGGQRPTNSVQTASAATAISRAKQVRLSSARLSARSVSLALANCSAFNAQTAAASSRRGRGVPPPSSHPSAERIFKPARCLAVIPDTPAIPFCRGCDAGTKRQPWSASCGTRRSS